MSEPEPVDLPTAVVEQPAVGHGVEEAVGGEVRFTQLSGNLHGHRRK